MNFKFATEFKIENLPSYIVVEQLSRKELHIHIKDIWLDVFPDHFQPQSPKSSVERESLRKEIAKAFNENNSTA